MNQNDVQKLRDLYLSGSINVKRRLELLKKLYAEVKNATDEIAAALMADFHKNAFDAYTTETGIVLEEIRGAVKHLKRWTKPKRVRTSLKNFPAKGYILSEGYGVALIVAPWNYPFQLCLTPLVGAIAAGCTAVVKPSAKTKNTFLVIQKILAAVFDGGEVILTDSRDVLDLCYDVIFFTGGTETGRTVLTKAAHNLTPVLLELGGKSPAIIDSSADLPSCARRLAWAKFVNGGQTCVAPDYFLVHKEVFEAFKAQFLAEVKKQWYNPDGSVSDELAYLITDEKGAEMRKMLTGANVLLGGDIEGRKMAPTVIEADFSAPCMQAELFAPLAPLIRFSDLNAELSRLNHSEKPLALYYFGRDKSVLSRAHFGGGCMNDALMHVSEGELPFGGVGASGMGRYHGKASFEAFTHYKSVLIKGKAELKVRYAPHTEKALRLAKLVEK